MKRLFFDGHHWVPSCYLKFDDYPNVAPFLAIENFVSFPVYSPTFCFSTSAITNILFIQEIKAVLERIDDLISRNKLHEHPFLISQACAQATLRLASKSELRRDWCTSVEMPFCLHVTEKGECPWTLDYEDLYKQAQWLELLEEVILPLDQMKESKLTKIAPHQNSTDVRNAIMKSRREKKTKQYSKSKLSNSNNSSL
ncbi:unnamed protein product [Caenorhabditis brenneri]